MTVEYRTGDLFEQTDVESLAHGVNCVGVMGGGIAKAFRLRYPEMYRQYRLHCRLGVLRPKGVFPWQTHHEEPGSIRYVFNIASQNLPGADAQLDWLDRGLTRAAVYASGVGVGSIALPRIGAGIGGLEWDDVKALIEDVDSHVSSIKFVVVSL